MSQSIAAGPAGDWVLQKSHHTTRWFSRSRTATRRERRVSLVPGQPHPAGGLLEPLGLLVEFFELCLQLRCRERDGVRPEMLFDLGHDVGVSSGSIQNPATGRN